MADHVAKQLFDELASGHKPGSPWLGADKFKGTEYGLEKALEGSHTFFATDLLNGSGSESKNELFVAPHDLQITEIRARRSGASANSATATLVTDYGGANTNPLSASNVDIDALTADADTAQTLNSTEANLQVKKGELIRCAWATDSAGTITNAAVTVIYKKVREGQI